MMKNRYKVYAVQHKSPSIAADSAMWALSQGLGMETIEIPHDRWSRLYRFSWRFGEVIRKFCVRRMGSDLSLCIPLWDDIRILMRCTHNQNKVVIHFLWGETCSPYCIRMYRRSASRVVGTFHATKYRQQASLLHTKWLAAYDWIIVVSSCQIPFFVDHGFPADRITVIPLGIDTSLFKPAEPDVVCDVSGSELLCGCVGSTERDHEFMAQLMRNIPAGLMKLKVLTSPGQYHYYDGLEGVELLPRLSDLELIQFYRGADLILLPMRDCTANNSLLEAMACGTSVLINDVGGASEYAPREFLLPSGDIVAWIDRIKTYQQVPEKILDDGRKARLWAEKFDWKYIIPQYEGVYEACWSKEK